VKRSELAKLVIIPLIVSFLLGIFCLLGSNQEVKFASYYEQGRLAPSEVKSCVRYSLLAFFLLLLVEWVLYSRYKAWQKRHDCT
jgi:hypothetical protein